MHYLTRSVALDHRLSVEIKTVSRFNLISQDIDPVSEIDLAAKFTVDALDSFLFKYTVYSAKH